MVSVMGMKNIFMRWQKDDTVPIIICCVGWWIHKTFKKGEDKTIYYAHNRIRRKKTDRLLPSNLVPSTALKTQHLGNHHIFIEECIILCAGSQGSAFSSYLLLLPPALCSSVWLIVPEESLNTNPAWQPLEAVVLSYWGVTIYYGPEFYYFKESWSSCYCLIIQGILHSVNAQINPTPGLQVKFWFSRHQNTKESFNYITTKLQALLNVSYTSIYLYTGAYPKCPKISSVSRGLISSESELPFLCELWHMQRTWPIEGKEKK